MSESANSPSSLRDLPPRLSQLCDRFEHAWTTSSPPRITDYLGDASGEERLVLLRKLVQLDILFRCRQGQRPLSDEYLHQFPILDARWLANELARNLAADPDLPTMSFAAVGDVPVETQDVDAPRAPLHCPHCCNLISVPHEAGGGIVCSACGSSFRLANLDQPTTLDETQWLGKFRLLRKVGQGSYGSVWRARDTQLQRDVALKIPHASLLSSSDYLERIQREARAAAQLRHPGIVRLYEVATIGDMPILVSDFIEGLPLRELLEVKRLTFTEAATLVAEAAEALHYAHGRGLIHRDIKPGNILMEFARPEEATGTPRSVGRPILVDFGLALREEAEIVMTLEGQIIGTPAYMSPEQAEGKGHQVDRRSDVYSLGVVLYQLLCGELPFRGSKAMLVHQVIHEEPRPPRRLNDKIPRGLETICLKAMAKETNRRYATAGDMAEDLRRFQRGEPIHARPAGRGERLWRWCRRNPTVAALTAAVASSLVLGTVIASYFAIRASKGEQEALHQADRARQERMQSEWRRYGAELNLAQRAWQQGQLALVQELLQAQVPSEEALDLRGFEWYYWQRLCGMELRTISGHDKPIRCLAFSPDGRWLASAGEDQTVRLWDMASEQESQVLKGHDQTISSLAFSADGRWLASASGGYAGDEHPLAGKVIVWERATGGVLCSFEGKEPFHSVAISADGQRLAVAGGGQGKEGVPRRGEVKVWDVIAKRELLALTNHATSVLSVAFSPDGRFGASGGSDGTLLVWDARSGKTVCNLQGHTAPVLSLSFSPNNRQLASASWDQTVRVWELSNGKELRTLRGHTGAVTSVAFSRDGGRRIASASWDQTVRVWDATTLTELFTYRGHTNTVYSVASSPDLWRLASASADQTIKIWNAFSPDLPATLRGHSNRVNKAVFSPDGRQLASASVDRTVKLWDVLLGTLTATLYGHKAIVLDVAYSPDGHHLASAGRDGVVQLWNQTTGEIVRTLSDNTKAVNGVAFSPDGRLLASAGADATVRLWDLATGKQLHILRGQTGPVYGVAFSPDGNWLASAGEDKIVVLWDTATGDRTRILSGHSGTVRGVAFSPDGNLLASSGDDSKVILWVPGTGERLHTLRGHSASVMNVAFSPLSSRLASASLDQTIKIWDTNTGQELCTLQGDTGVIFSVAFSRGGRRLASASADGSVQVWDATPLTPALQEQRQARSLVESLFAQRLSQTQVIALLHKDRTISAAVRQHALNLAAPYAKGQLHRDADLLLQSLSNSFPLKPDLVERIRAHPDLSESQRQATLALAEHYVENTSSLNLRSRNIVRKAFQELADYRLALRYAKAACRYAPQNGSFLTTLGMAQYRVGKYQEAALALRRASQISAAEPDLPQPEPASLAFLAMALYRLGQKEEAQETLQRLREAMREPPWSKQSEAQGFLREAEDVVTGRRKQDK